MNFNKDYSDSGMESSPSSPITKRSQLLDRITLSEIDLPSTSNGKSQRYCTPKIDKSTTTTVKVDKDDIRAKRHFLKTILIDGKENRIWECGLCSKEFKYQYTLIRHIPTHTDVRNFHCNICPKSFRQMSTLSQHKATHWDVRPFTCDVCSKCFNRISTLISHKKIHTDEKKHICIYCGKGFHQKGNLKNHMYTHTNERPYKCDLCGKGFNQKSNLVVHKNSTHLKKDDYCAKCKRSFCKPHIYAYHMEYFHNVKVDDSRVQYSFSNKRSKGRSLEPKQSPSNNTIKKVKIKEENVEDKKISTNLNVSIEQTPTFIEKKPMPEMLKLFAKNEVPFVLYFKVDQQVPAIYKAVMDGDHFALLNPNYQDISKYKNNLSPTEIPIVCVIYEKLVDSEVEYVIKPFKNFPVKKSQEEQDSPIQVVDEKTEILDSPDNNENHSSLILNNDENICNPGLSKDKNNLVNDKSFESFPVNIDPANIKTEEGTDILIMDNDPIISCYDTSNYSDFDLDEAKIDETLSTIGNNFLDYLNDSVY